MADFTIDDIATEGARQPESPWIRYSIDVGPGAPGFALIHEDQVEGRSDDDIRDAILTRINEDAKVRTKGVVAAQLRSSGIRVRTDIAH
jgi:hypothetical protein